jgi:hypothetical protein
MTIAVDEVILDTGTSSSSGVAIYTKVGNTSPTALTLQFISSSGSSTVAPSSVTYGGTPITLSTFSLWPGGGAAFTGYYGYLLAPPSGIQNLVINFSGTASRVLLATFWSGAVSGVNWTTRSQAIVSPVVNIAKAASSAVAAFVVNSNNPLQLDTFLGGGTERFINPIATALFYAATQEPAQGDGTIDWQNFNFEIGYSSLSTAHISAEILAATTLGGTFQMMFGVP